MLIIVGLIALAVVALLGAFLLGRGGENEEGTPQGKAVRTSPTQEGKPESVPATPITQSVQTTARFTRQLVDSNDDAATSMNHEHSQQPSAHTTPYPEPAAAESESIDGYHESLVALGHQLYELADQVHTLQSQSHEIEQKLAHLSSSIEQFAMRNVEQSQIRSSSYSAEGYELTHDE